MSGQIHNIFRLIDREIASTKEELWRVQTDDKMIEKDIVEFLEEYNSKRILTKEEREEFIKKNLPYIKKKKEASLNDALKKLTDLKRSFLIPLAGDCSCYD